MKARVIVVLFPARAKDFPLPVRPDRLWNLLGLLPNRHRNQRAHGANMTSHPHLVFRLRTCRATPPPQTLPRRGASLSTGILQIHTLALLFTLLFALLCFALLCFASPSVLLCFAFLCFALFFSSLLCFALLRSALLSSALLSFPLLCFTLLRFAFLCFALFCSSLLCFALLCFALLC